MRAVTTSYSIHYTKLYEETLRRERFEVARRQPSEAAVAEPRVGLALEELVEIDRMARQRAPHVVERTEVVEGGLERASYNFV